MGFEEKILNSQLLRKKVEFITIQASEQKEEEVRYKNVNRKQIRFDLNDLEIMSALGKLLRPYGIIEWLENKMGVSKIAVLRILGEKRLSKRAMRFLRTLYLKAPEKFAATDLGNRKSGRMKMVCGTLIISEEINQKTISLKDHKEDYLSELEAFRNKFKEEEAKLRQQEEAVKALTFEEEEKKRIGIGD